jgi:hypothetical protein
MAEEREVKKERKKRAAPGPRPVFVVYRVTNGANGADIDVIDCTRDAARALDVMDKESDSRYKRVMLT